MSQNIDIEEKALILLGRQMNYRIKKLQDHFRKEDIKKKLSSKRKRRKKIELDKKYKKQK